MPAIIAFLQNIALLLASFLLIAASSPTLSTPDPLEPSSPPPMRLYYPPLPPRTLLEPSLAASTSPATTTPPVATTSTPKPKPLSTPKPAPQPSTATPPTQAESQPTPAITLQEAINSITKLATTPPPTDPLNTLVRNALVNVLCTVNGDSFNSSIGSGVFIDPRGIILTNAHVAQLMLLKDYPTPNNVECVARVGSPAASKYRLEPLFISPEWVTRNASQIVSLDPRGNGEYDYALLRVVDSSTGEPLPTVFPFVNVSLAEVSSANNVLVAGYAAGFLDSSTILKNLYASSAIGQIKQIYTYGTSTIDVYSLSGTVVSQRGSSGGAVADMSGLLIGLIVTATMDATTAERTHNAISTPYIVRSFGKERGKPLASVLSSNLEDEAKIFATAYAPKLTALLISALGGR